MKYDSFACLIDFQALAFAVIIINVSDERAGFLADCLIYYDVHIVYQ